MDNDIAEVRAGEAKLGRHACTVTKSMVSGPSCVGCNEFRATRHGWAVMPDSMKIHSGQHEAYDKIYTTNLPDSSLGSVKVVKGNTQSSI